MSPRKKKEELVKDDIWSIHESEFEKITNRSGSIIELGSIVQSTAIHFSIGKVVEIFESKNGLNSIYAKVIPYICDSSLPFEEQPILELVKIDCLEPIKGAKELPWNVRTSLDQKELKDKDFYCDCHK